MVYNPQIHNRKSIRLEGFDYSSKGTYFITICLKDRHNLLWKNNIGNRVGCLLSDVGLVVETAINNIPDCYPNAMVDKYVIMPNHIHLILLLSENDACAMNDGRAMRAPTISKIINQMKGFVTKKVGFSIWQKSFYDHIIRNENEYQKICKYIEINPCKWEEDRYYKSP